MKEIRKKAYQPYFDEVINGDKTFDVRVADFDCQPGDILILEEVDNATKNQLGARYENGSAMSYGQRK